MGDYTKLFEIIGKPVKYKGKRKKYRKDVLMYIIKLMQ